jgi:hypothetical protein
MLIKPSSLRIAPFFGAVRWSMRRLHIIGAVSLPKCGASLASEESIVSGSLRSCWIVFRHFDQMVRSWGRGSLYVNLTKEQYATRTDSTDSGVSCTRLPPSNTIAPSAALEPDPRSTGECNKAPLLVLFAPRRNRVATRSANSQAKSSYLYGTFTASSLLLQRLVRKPWAILEV